MGILQDHFESKIDIFETRDTKIDKFVGICRQRGLWKFRNVEIFMFKPGISAVLATNLHGTCAWLEDKYSSWSLAYRKCFLVGAHNAGFAFRTIDRSKFMGRLASDPSQC